MDDIEDLMPKSRIARVISENKRNIIICTVLSPLVYTYISTTPSLFGFILSGIMGGAIYLLIRWLEEA